MTFLALRGIDRALAIASQAFTALVPLVLLVAALAPVDQGDVVADALVGRFRLTGDTAAAMRQLFANTGDGATGTLSVLLLVLSGISLTRRMQHMYEQAWRFEPRPGLAHTAHAGAGLAALLLGIALLYLARDVVEPLPYPDVLVVVVSGLAGFLVWTTVPWLLLDRRIEWRRLVPMGVLTAACSCLYGVATTVYMPDLLESYSRRYGLFGVTLALVGWLLAMAVIIVAATVVAAELDRAPEPWARRLRAPWAPGPRVGEADLADPAGPGALMRRG
ncbi:YhjD/YihY/BrkB family envelope integrity protein [Trujillonella endophytica]|uniref:Membrane protein n=1 Tax=Trujillonella endophytica TaxID=673521 RepID=A0A1H8QP16_9ACTN|nr:YhjD/YihY/BrkB family envelope integrity protein [Trujillella endophytica]SEO55776.1 membrane protein [Trujillella endophytica]